MLEEKKFHKQMLHSHNPKQRWQPPQEAWRRQHRPREVAKSRERERNERTQPKRGIRRKFRVQGKSWSGPITALSSLKWKWKIHRQHSKVEILKNRQFKHQTLFATQTQTQRNLTVKANQICRICHTLISHWPKNLGYVGFEFTLQLTFGA